MKNLLSFIIMGLLLAGSAHAQSQIIIVDKNALKTRADRRNQEFVLTVSGPAVNVSKEKGGQLSLYVRSCGFLTINKNSKNEAPKENQRITATLKERCKIDDWN